MGAYHSNDAAKFGGRRNPQQASQTHKEYLLACLIKCKDTKKTQQSGYEGPKLGFFSIPETALKGLLSAWKSCIQAF